MWYTLYVIRSVVDEPIVTSILKGGNCECDRQLLPVIDNVLFIKHNIYLCYFCLSSESEETGDHTVSIKSVVKKCGEFNSYFI
jgi:hypothetical protein